MSGKYKADLAAANERHDAALAELRAEKDSISNQLDESQKALASAQAEVSSFKAKVEEGEKALAGLREQLDAEIAQHRKLASAALRQPDEKLRTAAEIAKDENLTPAERSRLISEGKYSN